MRAPNEVWISLAVLNSMFGEGNYIEAKTINGVPRDAKLVGAHVRWPYRGEGADDGVLVLSYDRPVPLVVFRDLRQPMPSVVPAESEAVAHGG